MGNISFIEHADKPFRVAGILAKTGTPVDRTVPIAQAARIFEAARHPKSFVSLDRADHILSDPGDARYAGEVIAAWAGRYLGDGP